jgi:hypothetical protein
MAMYEKLVAMQNMVKFDYCTIYLNDFADANPSLLKKLIKDSADCLSRQDYFKLYQKINSDTRKYLDACINARDQDYEFLSCLEDKYWSKADFWQVYKESNFLEDDSGQVRNYYRDMIPTAYRFYKHKNYLNYDSNKYKQSHIAEAYKFIDNNLYRPKFKIQEILDDMNTGLKCSVLDNIKRNSCIDKIDQDNEEVNTDDRIGYGTYGTVYKSGNIVYKVSKSRDKYINKEINILKNLNHQNVLPLIKINNRGYSMPFMTCTIDKAGIKDLDFVFNNLVNGLHYLHSRQIIHRDLTVGNILYNAETNEIRISDFGLSLWYNRSIQYINNNVCSPIFRAPEIDFGLKYDTKSDIWSLGMVMLNLYLGQAYQIATHTDNVLSIYANIEKFGNGLDYLFILDPDDRPSSLDLTILLSQDNNLFTKPYKSPTVNVLGNFLTKYKKDHHFDADPPVAYPGDDIKNFLVRRYGREKLFR